ncbi:unnamed protein product [Schistosoma rodhaini]|uniref:UPF0506 domain-containing protein n=1 Tax=Schistosoma rodhaini TaxID=6188 RepID=A0AA85GAB2_9TREM|nr:unnamed protein product [Schistosoma rodhaini]CAH8632820.1 unnamed protein product [Schistosoma rodhaini]
MSVMCKSFLFSLFILSIFITKETTCILGLKCSEKGAKCTKTLFDRCCRNLVCELDGPFNGKCVDCLSLDSACIKDSECCSKRCYLFSCKPPHE